MANFPECPQSLKSIQHYLKAAQEHDSRDVVISYWCRLYSLQVGLKISTHQPDETKLLLAIMDWLEVRKKELSQNESVTNDVAAQAYLENYALKLFQFADKQDRESNFGKNVVKAFYTSGLIYDVLQTFGDLTDEATQNRKYAKWKAAYIHNCLKNGETPMAGPLQQDNDDENLEDENNAVGGNASNFPPSNSQDITPHIPSMGFAAFPPPGGSVPPPLEPTPSLGEVARNLPSPPVEPEKPPGGFQPYVPSGDNTLYQPPAQQLDVSLSAEQIAKAQKYCKWAGSALNYDDVKTAVENLHKALRLLQTGQDN